MILHTFSLSIKLTNTLSKAFNVLVQKKIFVPFGRKKNFENELFFKNRKITLETEICNLRSCHQSHYWVVPRCEIFMEQELRFRLDLGRMADFPTFIASQSFDLWSHHTPQKCLYNLQHILIYQKYMKLQKKHFKSFIG